MTRSHLMRLGFAALILMLGVGYSTEAEARALGFTESLISNQTTETDHTLRWNLAGVCNLPGSFCSR